MNRDAWVQIDLGAIRANLHQIRKLVGPDVLIMSVVKADAYGHGAIPVAQTAIRAGAKYLGVATVDEAIELAEAGLCAGYTNPASIMGSTTGSPYANGLTSGFAAVHDTAAAIPAGKAKILVLSQPPLEAIPELLHYQILTAAYTNEFLLALGEAAAARHQVAEYHLKIDTGFNRIGTHWSDAADLLHSLDFHEGLHLDGVFTHFATADAPDSFGLQTQLNRFEEALENIRYVGINPHLVHAAASAATIRFKETHFNMVRVGIAQYGLHPAAITKNLVKLEPAMSVHARIVRVVELPFGEGVSYGWNYQSPGGVEVFTLPLGYADGLRRGLSGNLQVAVAGQLFRQVGNICMDMSMYEHNLRPMLGTRPVRLQIGDEAIIVGSQDGPDGRIDLTLDDLALRLGTINYELACGFGSRLERLYTE